MKKFFKFLFRIILIVAAVLAFLGFVKYHKATHEMPLDEKIAEIRANENYTEISDIPKTFINAMVAVEDRRFFKHGGFDIIGVARATYVNIKSRDLAEGGSTITQQLAKNLYFPQDSTPSRKIAELYMAFKLEKTLTKYEILELYFNVIYYGKGCYNIHDAAEVYFGKSPSDMTDSECTLLAGIPNAPSVYSNNTELARNRQEKVLRSMLKSGYITEKEMKDILDE